MADDGSIPGPLPQAAVPYTTGVSVPAPNPAAAPAPYVPPTVAPDLGEKVGKAVVDGDDADAQKQQADQFQQWLNSGTNGLLAAGQSADQTYPDLNGMGSQLAQAHIEAMKAGADPEKTMTAYGTVLKGLVDNLQTNKTKAADAAIVDARSRAISNDRNATQIKLESMRTAAARSLKVATQKNTDAAITAAVKQSATVRAAMKDDIDKRQAKVDSTLAGDPDNEMAKLALESIEKDKQDMSRMELEETNLLAKRQSVPAPDGPPAVNPADPFNISAFIPKKK